MAFDVRLGNRTFSRIVVSCVATTEVTSTIAETPFCQVVIPGGTLSTKNLLRASAILDQLNNTAAVACTVFKVYYGGTVIGQITTANLPQSATRAGLHLTTEIAAIGATNTQVAYTQVTNAIVAATGVAGTCDYSEAKRGSYHTGMAIDSTANQTLSFTAINATNASTLSVKCYAVHVEQVPG